MEGEAPLVVRAKRTWSGAIAELATPGVLGWDLRCPGLVEDRDSERSNRT